MIRLILLLAFVVCCAAQYYGQQYGQQYGNLLFLSYIDYLKEDTILTDLSTEVTLMAVSNMEDKAITLTDKTMDVERMEDSMVVNSTVVSTEDNMVEIHMDKPDFLNWRIPLLTEEEPQVTNILDFLN